jgi:membrane protease subunit (stomatin/prohibitin family)
MMITMSKTGIALRREFVKIMEQSMEEAQQQQQNGTQQQQQNGTTQSQTEQVVCQSCGWKNPKANNFCHDCGNEI